MDVDEVMMDVEERMDKSVRALQDHLTHIRTGKASLGLFDGMVVNLYGTEIPLQQCANLMTPEPRLIVIQPYDKNAIPAISKSILSSDLGLNPVNDGTVLRIAIPPLTEERRKDLVRVVHNYAEEGRTSVRQVRRSGNDEIKKLEKDSEISEDEMHRVFDEIQKLTDDHVKRIDKIMEDKEKEIMEI
ncbi:ribosome recycling factor [bacterium]|nr:ribosome recycling factor [bacterium]